MASQPKRELWLGAGAHYKFVNHYRSLVGEVVEGPVAIDEVVLAAHPDGEIGLLEYRTAHVERRIETEAWSFRAELVGEPPNWGPRATPRVHDFTRQRWGHELRFERGERAKRCFGWALGLRQGDFFLVQRPGTRMYLIEQIQYDDDPVDLFFAHVKEMSCV